MGESWKRTRYLFLSISALTIRRWLMDWKIEASSLWLRRSFDILNKQQTSTANKLLTLQCNLTDWFTDSMQYVDLIWLATVCDQWRLLKKKDFPVEIMRILWKYRGQMTVAVFYWIYVMLMSLGEVRLIQILHSLQVTLDYSNSWMSSGTWGQ